MNVPKLKPVNWLLIRGLAREARHWGDFKNRLEEQTPGKVIALDLPGAGTECDRVSPKRVAAMTDDIRSRWIPFQKNAAESWGVLGISLGGMVVLDWLARFPEDFSRTVVINTSFWNWRLLFGRLRLANLYTLALIAWTRDPVEREKRILHLTSNTLARSENLKGLEETARRYGVWAKERPMTLANQASQFFAASRFALDLSAFERTSLGKKVQVLAAEKDRLVDYRCSKLLAEKTGAKLSLHPNAGHDLTVDDPEWVLRELKGTR